MPQIAFPPRNDGLDFVQLLNQFYRDTLKREACGSAVFPIEGLGPLYIDVEGLAVWLQEYLRLRANGASHDTACKGVFAQIDRIVNPPDLTAQQLAGTVTVQDA